jgi:hypothetical protein
MPVGAAPAELWNNSMFQHSCLGAEHAYGNATTGHDLLYLIKYCIAVSDQILLQKHFWPALRLPPPPLANKTFADAAFPDGLKNGTDTLAYFSTL